MQHAPRANPHVLWDVPVNVNLFFEDSYLALVSTDSNVTSELSGPGTFTITPITQTPLPGALPLFASGLSALGLLGWWRKRKDKASAAANG